MDSPFQNLNNLLSNVVNQYIVRPTGTISSSGISGFVFDVLGDEEAKLTSDITDHFVEDNYAIQDHISLRPLTFSVTGYVAELTDLFPAAALSVLTKVQSLSSIGGFLPRFTAQATQIYGQIAGVAAKVNERINQAANVYDLIKGSSTTATKQQNAYTTFYSLWLNRQLCSVETPYGVFKNMAIENVLIVQRDRNRFVSDFTVLFKQINVTRTSVTAIPAQPNPAGSGSVVPASPVANANQQSQPTQGLPVKFSQASRLTNNLKDRASDMVAPRYELGQTQGSPTVPKVTAMPLLTPPGFTPGEPLTPMMMKPTFL